MIHNIANFRGGTECSVNFGCTSVAEIFQSKFKMSVPFVVNDIADFIEIKLVQVQKLRVKDAP